MSDSHSKTIAVMQPYFLPYIGYWQLLAAVDVFVLLDDVSFIPGGWINRNRILAGGQEFVFTLPVANGSQNSRICDLNLIQDSRAVQKLGATIRQAYAKSPHFDEVMPCIEQHLNFQNINLADHLHCSIDALANHFKLEAIIKRSSTHFAHVGGKGQERIIGICIEESATRYINLPGGKQLYSAGEFASCNIELRFLEPRIDVYPQRANVFLPRLSIIDMLFQTGIESTAAQAKGAQL